MRIKRNAPKMVGMIVPELLRKRVDSNPSCSKLRVRGPVG